LYCNNTIVQNKGSYLFNSRCDEIIVPRNYPSRASPSIVQNSTGDQKKFYGDNRDALRIQR